ncbi:MAG: glycosyltransferase family 2 protein [Acidobacteriota bacterium]|nr:glycosyltransferase family 2 protein [Acidobacteriota bacterium]
MNREETPKTQLDSANESLRQVEAALTASQRQLKRVVELVEKHEAQLASLQSSVTRLDRITMEMLTGRVWRTLRAAGDLAKRFVPRSASEGSNSVVLNSTQQSFLVCDEPKVSDLTLRSGNITVRGWCLAQGGVDSVQVEIPGIPKLEVTPSIARPDVKKHHPHLDTTGRAGFETEFDSLSLHNGHHVIVLRLISKGKPIRETKTSVQIDHENGFASEYQKWIHDFEVPDDDLSTLKLLSFSSRPTFSVLMPVYNTDPAVLTAAIESVLAQSYGNWELCIADDRSSKAETREVLERFAAQDIRIKVVYGSESGGISRTCNLAWEMATGDYIAFLDHDDTLAPHALSYICEALDRDSSLDLLYSDEDKIDGEGKRFDPFFKPDWSPDLLLSENYICHLLVLRQDLSRKIGRLNPDCDGSQDYDLILRATEQARKIHHIPKVLYHWRAVEGSTAVTQENKQYAISAAQRAIQQHFARTNQEKTVEPSRIAGRWRVRYPIPPGFRVSIIIASGGKLDILRANLDSLLAKTTYRDFEIVVIDNSKHNGIESYIREQRRKQTNVRYIDWRNKPFNYSAINNAAARECDSPVLLFLNDDTSVIEPGWLEAMVELAVRPEVGCVGAKLLYPEGRIQHAGVVMGLYDNCGHAFKGLDGSISHYFDFPDVIRNVSAVTGACLMTRAEVFWKVGGFNEVEFAVAFNDIDLCLKIGNEGYRVLYTPHALLYHHEAFSKTSRDLVPHPQEVETMRLTWGNLIAADPYYNPNLTRNDEDYSLKTRI